MAVTTLAGCGSEASAPSPSQAPGRSQPPEPPATTPTAPVERVAPEAPAGQVQRVTFTTEDGVRLVGSVRWSATRGAPAVVLVHQLSSSRQEWAPVVAALSEPPGLTTLALDLRGHGESTSGPSGALDWQRFEQSDYEAMAKDVAAAVAYLRADPGTRPNRVVVVGSSIGSTAALLAAAADPTIAAVALLSPGRAYRGVDAITPASRLGQRPLLAIAASGEQPSTLAGQDMARVAASGRFVSAHGSAHGVAQLAEDPAAMRELLAFLREPVATPQPARAAPAPEPAADGLRP